MAEFHTMIDEFGAHNYTIVPGIVPGIYRRTESILNLALDILSDPAMSTKNFYWYNLLEFYLPNYIKNLPLFPDNFEAKKFRLTETDPAEWESWKLYQLYRDIESDYKRNYTTSLMTLAGLGGGHWKNILEALLWIPFDPDDPIRDKRVSRRKRRKPPTTPPNVSKFEAFVMTMRTTNADA